MNNNKESYCNCAYCDKEPEMDMCSCELEGEPQEQCSGYRERNSGIVLERARSTPSAWTFTIKPIKALLERYVPSGDNNWVDPFAGKNSPAQWRNDHNPEMNAQWHMDAKYFCDELVSGNLSYVNSNCRFPIEKPFAGVLFDPPYSYRQISEHYKMMGMKATQLDTSTQFYSRVMNSICDSIQPNGCAISFGWNSNGFGKNRGFEIVEILLVAHGTHHNDTIVTVERKI